MLRFLVSVSPVDVDRKFVPEGVVDAEETFPCPATVLELIRLSVVLSDTTGVWTLPLTRAGCIEFVFRGSFFDALLNQM